MRDPALHITLSGLTAVLTKLGIRNPAVNAERILTESAPYAIKDRYDVKLSSKAAKRAVKHKEAVAASSISVEQFNGILYTARETAGHKAITPIRKGEAMWTALAEVAVLASDFSAACGFTDTVKGCQVFISIGLRMMRGKYGLNKFKYYKEKIYEYYAAVKEVEEDDDRQATNDFCNTWVTELFNRTGLKRKYSEPTDMAMFVMARKQADALDAYYDDYINAQFDGLSFLGVVPSLTQLVSDNAEQRYWNYISNARKTVSEHLSDVNKEDFLSDIKKIN
ncbi:MAG: hypothetical protein H6550_15985 [Chitinophagales bacterium]|nr:hypothetical protein [Chitinophagales bacterium]